MGSTTSARCRSNSHAWAQYDSKTMQRMSGKQIAKTWLFSSGTRQHIREHMAKRGEVARRKAQVNAKTPTKHLRYSRDERSASLPAKSAVESPNTRSSRSISTQKRSSVQKEALSRDHAGSVVATTCGFPRSLTCQLTRARHFSGKERPQEVRKPSRAQNQLQP